MAIANQTVSAITAKDVFKSRQAVITICAEGGIPAKVNRDIAARIGVACPIRAVPANQRVIAGAAIQRVIGKASIEHIGLAVTDDAVIAVTAKNVFNP